jgi:hypothetical protein
MQCREVGNALCRINKRKSSAPMPGSYAEHPPEEREAETLPDPNWTKMPVKGEMLLLVAKRFSKDQLEGISLDFIATGANPTSVIRDNRR